MDDVTKIMIVFVICFAGLIKVTYDNLEYKGYPRNSNCSGECYREYVAKYGTVVDQLKAKQELAAEDPFSSIKGLWSGCAACHGQDGAGIGMFPALAGSSQDYIYEALVQYKNKETRGNMSSTMWAQAGQLSDQEMKTLSEYIEQL